MVYPNREEEGDEGNVTVFLGSENDEDVVVRWGKITVGEESRQFHTHDDCRAVLQDGNLRVKVEVELPGNMMVVNMDPGDGKKSGNNWILENLYKRRSEADFSLICEGQAVPIHSQVDDLCWPSALI
jgi:hypothetical protein